MTPSQTTVSQEVLDSLAVDLAKEHGAIVQYIIHAGQLRDSVLFASVMAAAREETWHMEWLIEAIRDRGGEPVLDRAEVVTGDGLVANLQADMAAEDGALAHYEVTLGLIGDTDEELTRLVQRIMDDERYHRTSFSRMAERVGAEGEQAFRPSAVTSPADAGTTAPMIGLEYEGLLQYLWNKYGAGDTEVSETYFELAINEMRHLRWVATCLAGLGAPPAPPVPVDAVARVEGEAAARREAERYEDRAAGVIGRVTDGVSGEPMRDTMRRIAYQHDWHRFQLEHLP
jgi:bacterioferritin